MATRAPLIPHHVAFPLSLAVNCVCLAAAVFFLGSLFAHFKTMMGNKTSRIDPTAEYLAKWMSRGAFGAVTAGFPMFALFITHFGSRGLLDNTGCLVTENLPVPFFFVHKFFAYMFIYFRAKTFQDFFSERGWARLRIFAIIAITVYFLIIFIVLPYVSFTGQEAFDASAGYCKKTRVTSSGIATVLGALLILTDVSIAGVGTISFVRILFCSETLSQITRKDPEIAKAGKNVAVWSTIALVSTVLNLAISVATDLVLFASVDVAINSFCICKQYPDCLSSLLRLIFGKFDSTETMEMNRVESDPEAAVPR